jgi:hypothetical protein
MAATKKTPEQEAADLIAQVESEPAPPTCPAPDTCFPNGIDESWSAWACVHGQYER